MTPSSQDDRRVAVFPRPMEKPEHCPGCYVMHFYCKYENPEHPRQKYAPLYMEEADQVETRTAAIRQIREAGWIYHKNGTATCPLCVKALREQGRQP